MPVTHRGGKIDAADMHDDVVTSSGGPERVCPNCHSIVGPGVQFCPHCGEPMGGHPRSRAWPAVLAAIVAVILGAAIGFGVGSAGNGSTKTVTQTTTTAKGAKSSNTNVTVTAPTETKTVTAPAETVTQTVTQTVTTSTTSTGG